jgi:hypothetical protein
MRSPPVHSRKKTVKGAAEVAKYSLGSGEVRLLRGVHVKPHLLDRVGDTRSDEDEEL